MIRPHLTAQEIREDVQAARGRGQADLVLKNCRLINVYSREIHGADLAIRRGRIVAIRENFAGPAARTLDADGSFVAPALVDSVFSGGKTPATPGSRRGTGTLLIAGDFSGKTLRDHDIACSFEETKHCIRHGKTAFLDERTGPDKLTMLLAEIRRAEIDFSNICFALSPESRIVEDSHPISLALASGFSIPEAFQIGALNPATHFCLDDVIGSLAPGRLANLILFDDLKLFRPARLILNGHEVTQP